MWGPYDAGPTASGQITLDAVRHALPPAIPPGGCTVVDARDVAADMLRVAEMGRSGERYVLSGPFVELGEIITRLAALRRGKPPKVHLPFAGATWGERGAHGPGFRETRVPARQRSSRHEVRPRLGPGGRP